MISFFNSIHICYVTHLKKNCLVLIILDLHCFKKYIKRKNDKKVILTRINSVITYKTASIILCI